LNDEFEQLLERIYDTVFLSVLRRYHLEYYADLFERDRVEFEMQREIGRRAIMPVRDNTEAVKLTDDYF
jgi:hypothetical protein